MLDMREKVVEGQLPPRCGDIFTLLNRDALRRKRDC